MFSPLVLDWAATEKLQDTIKSCFSLNSRNNKVYNNINYIYEVHFVPKAVIIDMRIFKEWVVFDTETIFVLRFCSMSVAS